MGEIADRFAEAWRDYTVDGVPGSGAHDPAKGEIRALGDLLDKRLSAAIVGITTVADTAARDAFYATPANRDKLIYVNNNNGSASDPANGVYEYAAGAPRLATSLYDGLAVVVDPLVQDAKDAAGNTELISDAITGAPAALPIGNNPNDLIAKVANADNEQPFEVLIVDTNTGPAWLEASGFRRAIGRDGAGNDTVAGDLTKGKIATFQYSAGGGRFILIGTRDIDGSDADPLASLRPILIDNPYGNVQNSGGTISATPVQFRVLGGGSSISIAQGGSLATDAPNNILVNLINSRKRQAGFEAVSEIVGQAGTGTLDMAAQFAAATGVAPERIRTYVPGMNDAYFRLFIMQHGFPNMRAALLSHLLADKAAGRLSFVWTSPDPNPNNVDLASEMPTDKPMTYPVFKGAPISAADARAALGSDLTPLIDFTGSGVLTRGCRTFAHFNAMVRDTCRIVSTAVCIDAAWSFRRYGLEPAWGNTAAINALYNGSDQNHFSSTGYQVGYGRATKPAVDALLNGDLGTRYFRGDEVLA